jgi:hypothetical protein
VTIATLLAILARSLDVFGGIVAASLRRRNGLRRIAGG